MSTTRMHEGQALPSPGMRLFKGVVLTLTCALVVLPFIGVVSTSLAPKKQVTDAGGFVFFPEGLQLDAYASILGGGMVTRAIGVSLFVAVVGTVLSLTATTLLAYSLANPRTVGRRWMLLLVLFTMLFHPGMIPMYLTVKQAGLIDTLWALIVPTMISAFNVVIVRAFFMNLPQELFESARIDGAGEWHIFSRITLPLSKAILAVVGLFYAVGYWNAFFNAVLYINDQAKWPIQVVLRTYVVEASKLGEEQVGLENMPAQPSLQMAILVISIVPILVVYPFLQRHFAKGVLTGAVKG
ncbi:carbohydrate ABC transporter permease [Streptomyces sp. NPDC047981]|uniref:carbohydrate ABC transporter permease n=1 Tax=Streptomyces sp. NPDC047981 TaxID=3154610 RepID=UPI003438564D